MDYLQTLEELQDYYSNLLIIQYNGKPKAKATIELLTRLVYSNMALLQIRDAFDWKTAEEAQLDIIGKWEGVDKAYTKNNTWSNTYLSYPSYGTETDAEDDPQRGGYSDYSNFDTLDGGVLTYKDLQANKQELDPEQYRTVIGLKIIKNHIVQNQGNIDEAIFQYFNADIDNKLAQSFSIISETNASVSTCMAYGNGTFVILQGGSGICGIWKSTDKINWQQSTTYDIGEVKALIYDNDLFITESGGKIYTSSTAETWTQTSASVSQRINCIYAQNDYYYAISGINRKLNIISKDFSEVQIIDLPDYNWIGITYFNKNFVIFSRNGYFSSSADLKIWEAPQRAYSNNSFTSLLNIGSRLIAFNGQGYNLTTKNGKNWYLTSKGYVENSSIYSPDLINGVIYGLNGMGGFCGLKLLNVYTTWQAHELTYHYDSSLSTIINVCYDKGVLPVPTGVKINLSAI